MKSIRLEWTETIEHVLVVNVPDDFTLDVDYAEDIANDVEALGELGFAGCQRSGFSAEPVAFHRLAETLYEEQ